MPQLLYPWGKMPCRVRLDIEEQEMYE